MGGDPVTQPLTEVDGGGEVMRFTLKPGEWGGKRAEDRIKVRSQ